MDRSTRSSLRCQSSDPVTSCALARSDAPISTPVYGRGHIPQQAGHQNSAVGAPPPHLQSHPANPHSYYLPLPTGYGFPSGTPMPVYWGPPGYQSPGWNGHLLQQRPLFGSQEQPPPNNFSRQHMLQTPQQSFVAANPSGPQWVQLHQSTHQHQPSQLQQNQRTQQPSSPRAQQPGQYGYLSPITQQQHPASFQRSSRAKSLIPGNGERSSSSSLRSTQRRSVGSVRSTSVEDRPEPPAEPQPENEPISLLTEHQPASQDLGSRDVEPSHAQLATTPPQIARPIQPPCAHFLKSGRCGFGDR